MRRPGALAFLAVGGRIAAARLDLDGQPHLLDRRDQIALDVMGERLERRDIERVEPIGRCLTLQPRRAEGGQRRQEPRQRLACAGIRDQQSVASRIARREHFGLMAPHAPVAASEPGFDFRRYRGRAHPEIAPDGARCSAPPPPGANSKVETTPLRALRPLHAGSPYRPAHPAPRPADRPSAPAAPWTGRHSPAPPAGFPARLPSRFPSR